MFDCSLSGKVMGYMAQIYLHNDSFADAWSVLFAARFLRNVYFANSDNVSWFSEN